MIVLIYLGDWISYWTRKWKRYLFVFDLKKNCIFSVVFWVSFYFKKIDWPKCLKGVINTYTETTETQWVAFGLGRWLTSPTEHHRAFVRMVSFSIRGLYRGKRGLLSRDCRRWNFLHKVTVSFVGSYPRYQGRTWTDRCAGRGVLRSLRWPETTMTGLSVDTEIDQQNCPKFSTSKIKNKSKFYRIFYIYNSMWIFVWDLYYFFYNQVFSQLFFSFGSKDRRQKHRCEKG